MIPNGLKNKKIKNVFSSAPPALVQNNSLKETNNFEQPFEKILMKEINKLGTNSIPSVLSHTTPTLKREGNFLRTTLKRSKNSSDTITIAEG